MHRQRNVLLFGAGAVIDWKAPFTYQLTDLVRRSGFLITDNKTTITDFIYKQLKESNNYSDADINFETIINVIEELIVYYSSFNARQKLPSIPHIIFSSKFEDELLNFSIEGGIAKHGFKLEIPTGIRSEFSKSAVNYETPEQFFFQQLVEKILTDIIKSILKYAGNSKVLSEDNAEMNGLFSKWINKINGIDILRMYSLNYDRIFKIILEKLNEHFPIFEGFDCKNTLEYSSNLTPNVRRILEDTDCNVHYNLHGSAFWKVEARDDNQLPNPAFYLSEAPFLLVNSYENAIWQSEKGKTIMLTNIITGYQKTQKGIFPPFKQMQAAFDKDCCFADNIYIVGYSFNDEHINASIKTAIQYNKDLKIIIIEPNYTKNDFDLNVAIKIFSCAGDLDKMKPTTPKTNLHSFFDGKILVHTKTFKEYLAT
ncbi:MAG TPA: hypothetical protein VLZ83_03465 [Edaphocola sp.]|nr:hypothetical protein [Edaphocola sp.]